MLCFVAVDAEYRRQHIAEKMVSYMLKFLDPERDIIVTTYREGVPEGIAARAFYKHLGFAEGKLTEEFGSPVQEFVLMRHKVEIETLACDVLELSLGAGKADIKNLTANSNANIDGGAGELNIDGGKLCNLNLDMGVGKLTLKSRIEGKSDLDYGVGETDLILLGSKDDYKIKLDKGIGEARLDGESMRDDSVYGSGENFIEIDGGIGEINIEFSKD